MRRTRSSTPSTSPGEPRIELKAHSVPLYADPSKSKAPRVTHESSHNTHRSANEAHLTSAKSGHQSFPLRGRNDDVVIGTGQCSSGDLPRAFMDANQQTQADPACEIPGPSRGGLGQETAKWSARTRIDNSQYEEDCTLIPNIPEINASTACCSPHAHQKGQNKSSSEEQQNEIASRSKTYSKGCTRERPARERLQDHVGEKQSSTIHVTNEKDPSDGIYFAQYKGHPDTLVVYRSPEKRAINPERLNLDRRHLTVCPVLKSEERIRLLNYQNNYIVEIQNLQHLPNLIFLDLYNNCIQHLSPDLDYVPTLRVLMLGKNRIKVMSHLNKLVKLDVLDLHSNAIAKIEHLNTLSELRVLNLAGNRLVELDQLNDLRSLTELNVRRNQIIKANSLQHLQSLQRVFLSNNRIQSFDAIACLFGVRFLMELSLDGNPIALKDPHAYRRFTIGHVKTLRHLDLKRVTDAERRVVVLEAQKEDELRRAAEKNEMIEFERRKLQSERFEAICAAERQWIDQTAGKSADHQTHPFLPHAEKSVVRSLSSLVLQEDCGRSANDTEKPANTFSSRGSTGMRPEGKPPATQYHLQATMRWS